jgi:ribosome biogenesis protein NSA2
MVFGFCFAADLKATFQLQILGVKKNPQSPMYTQLGVLTKGTVIEVNVSELGMVTTGGKVVFGKYAQITNNPENDGCINAVLRALSCCICGEVLVLILCDLDLVV